MPLYSRSLPAVDKSITLSAGLPAHWPLKCKCILAGRRACIRRDDTLWDYSQSRNYLAGADICSTATASNLAATPSPFRERAGVRVFYSSNFSCSQSGDCDRSGLKQFTSDSLDHYHLHRIFKIIRDHLAEKYPARKV